jgi:hypothetical protein
MMSLANTLKLIGAIVKETVAHPFTTSTVVLRNGEIEIIRDQDNISEVQNAPLTKVVGGYEYSEDEKEMQVGERSRGMERQR